MKEFIDQNCIIREQRIKCYSYLYLHLQKPLFPFWVKLISSKIANYDSKYKYNSVVQKAQSSYYTQELLDVIKASNYHVWHTLKMRARSLVFFSLLKQTFMNVTQIYNQFNKWKGLLQAILTVFQKSLVNTVRSKDARVCHS